MLDIFTTRLPQIQIWGWCALLAIAAGCGSPRAAAQAGGTKAAPTEARAESVELAGLSVSVWRPARVAAGGSPLVVFSHGFHGSSTQSTFLMCALAQHGYFVTAPNHQDSLRAGIRGRAPMRRPSRFADPGDWSAATFRDRGQDVRTLIDALRKDSRWSREIDWRRIALMGHSLGGYTVLGLAGAWPSWELPGVRAVVALSPYCAPFLEKSTLGSIRVPVMYQGGTLDVGITPTVKRPGGAYDRTRSPACFVEFRGAGHFAWTDLNPRFQASIIHYCVGFLDRYLKGDRTVDFTTRLPDVADLRLK